MKTAPGFILISILTALSSASAAGIGTQLRGYTLTEFYVYEGDSTTQHRQVYQALSFRWDRLAAEPLSLVGFMRYQGDNADDFSQSSLLKVHSLYLRLKPRSTCELRLGRQFLAEGVTVGTYDVLKLKSAPVSWGSATIWGGLAAPPDRAAELQSSDSAPSFGVALRGRPSNSVKITASYLRQERDGDLFRHRAGVSSSFILVPKVSGNALAHFNLEGPNAIDRLRLLLRYLPSDGIRLFSEFAVGSPQLPPDSPFENIEIETFQLFRVGGAYRVTEGYWVGLRVQSFISSDEPNSTLGLSLEGPWGTLGYRQRFGDFGDESGVWGSVLYEVTSYARVYGSADFSRYKFEEYDEEDQAAIQAGVRLIPLRSLECDASLQGLKNYQFDSDIRGLLRVKWSFGS